MKAMRSNDDNAGSHSNGDNNDGNDEYALKLVNPQ